jgi:predicted CopG family antitoxin
MASKIISIRQDLYQKLSKLKDKNESFSDLIDRLLNEGLKGSPTRLMKHFGVWAESTWSSSPEE